jgi:hypothetical protein
MNSEFSKLVQQYIDQQQEQLRLLGATITEKTHRENPNTGYSTTTIIDHRRNKVKKAYNLVNGLTGGPAHYIPDDVYPHLSNQQQEPVKLRAGSTIDKSTKIQKSYELMKAITSG